MAFWTFLANSSSFTTSLVVAQILLINDRRPHLNLTVETREGIPGDKNFLSLLSLHPGHEDLSIMNLKKRRRQDSDETCGSSPRRAHFKTDENQDSYPNSVLLAGVKEAFRKKAEVSNTSLYAGTLQLMVSL